MLCCAFQACCTDNKACSPISPPSPSRGTLNLPGVLAPQLARKAVYVLDVLLDCLGFV